MHSEPRSSPRTGKRRAARKTLLLIVWAAFALPLHAGNPLTREEALAAAFPGSVFHPERLFLTDSQVTEAASLAGVGIPSAMLARYRAEKGGILAGFAYVDTHVVRSKKESLLIILDAGGSVRRIEVTAFLEPAEYQATAAWYAQYQGKSLDPDLNLQRAIRPLAGATLTAVATNLAVRRVLAIHSIVERHQEKAAPR